MIEKNSFEQAIPLATIFASKGIKVSPILGTPFEKLVGSTELISDAAVCLDINGNDLTVEERDAQHLSEASSNPSHNAFFDQTVDLLSQSVAAHISIAKNVISPLVVEASEKIIERMKTEIEVEPSYKIVQVGLPEPMQNESIKDSVLKASGGINADPEKYLKLSDKSPQELQELMLTGSKEFDEKIKLWFVSKGDAFFDNVWKNSFMDPAANNGFIPCGLLESFKGKQQGTDYALAVFFLARRLMNEVPADTNMTLAEYNRTVAQYIEVAAVKLDKEYKDHEANVKAGVLVFEHNEKKMEVVVCEDTYLSYIQAGGKNEVLFGSLVQNQIPYLVDSIRGKEQECLEAWNRFTAFSTSTTKNKAFSKFKEICISVFLAQFAEPTDIEKERDAGSPGLMGQISQVIYDYVTSLSIDSMNDPYTVSLQAVAGIRFQFTNALRFLTSINEICKQNPEIEVREAALIATVEYVTDHLIEQMKLV